MANKKTAAATRLPAVEGAAFIRAGKYGDIILDIQVIPNAASTEVEGLHGAGDQVALKSGSTPRLWMARPMTP